MTASVALIPLAVWFVHPTEQEVEQVYREMLRAEAEQHGSQWIAESVAPHSEKLKTLCTSEQLKPRR